MHVTVQSAPESAPRRSNGVFPGTEFIRFTFSVMEQPNGKLCPNCESWVEKEAILKRKLDLLEREGSQNRKIIRQLAREVKRVHVEKCSVATSLYRTESAVSDADTIGSVSSTTGANVWSLHVRCLSL